MHSGPGESCSIHTSPINIDTTEKTTDAWTKLAEHLMASGTLVLKGGSYVANPLRHAYNLYTNKTYYLE
jgi:hypothetical protein